MMFKALLVVTCILIATDYALTGGNNLSACLRNTAHFFKWLGDAGSNSVFAK